MALDVPNSSLQVVVHLTSVLSCNRTNAEVLEEVMALISGTDSVDAEMVAEIMDLSLRREDHQAASEATARVPGELSLLLSFDKGHPCTLSSSVVVNILGLAVGEEMLSMTVTDLTCMQAALDPKHEDNIMPAIAQKGGPQMICELIDLSGTLFQGLQC